MKFHLAERPIIEDNLLSSISPKQFRGLNVEMKKRLNFPGEYSIFSSLNPRTDYHNHMWNDMMKNFSAVDIALPVDIEDFIHSDLNLKNLRASINEDVWIQVVHARQVKPSIDMKTDTNYLNMVDMIYNDLDTLLIDIEKKEKSREYIVRSMLLPLRYNIKRVGQSFARSDENSKLGKAYLKRARDLIIDNFTGFINHYNFKKILLAKKKTKRTERYSVLITLLINNPFLTTAEIYNELKSMKLFSDIYDLQELLDWSEKKGYIVSDGMKRYRTV